MIGISCLSTQLFPFFSHVKFWVLIESKFVVSIVLQYFYPRKNERKILISDFVLYLWKKLQVCSFWKKNVFFSQFSTRLVIIQCKQCRCINPFTLIVCIESHQDYLVVWSTSTQQYLYARFYQTFPFSTAMVLYPVSNLQLRLIQVLQLK